MNNFLVNITWSVLWKHTAQTKKVHYITQQLADSVAAFGLESFFDACFFTVVSIAVLILTYRIVSARKC